MKTLQNLNPGQVAMCNGSHESVSSCLNYVYAPN